MRLNAVGEVGEEVEKEEEEEFETMARLSMENRVLEFFRSVDRLKPLMWRSKFTSGDGICRVEGRLDVGDVQNDPEGVQYFCESPNGLVHSEITALTFVNSTDNSLVVGLDSDPAILETLALKVKHEELDGEAFQPADVVPWALPAGKELPSVPMAINEHANAPDG